MEKYSLNEDVRVLCCKASSFPDGIIAAFQTLEKLIAPGSERNFYGISWMEGSEIVYKAAVEEEFAGESQKLHTESFIIKKGEYLGEEVKNFRSNPERIGRIFRDLLAHPQVDPIAPCIESYSKDGNVLCMIKMK